MTKQTVEVTCGDFIHMVQISSKSYTPQEPGDAQINLRSRGFMKKRTFVNAGGSMVQIWEKNNDSRP